MRTHQRVHIITTNRNVGLFQLYKCFLFKYSISFSTNHSLLPQTSHRELKLNLQMRQQKSWTNKLRASTLHKTSVPHLRGVQEIVLE